MWAANPDDDVKWKNINLEFHPALRILNTMTFQLKHLK
jgi:hypothetical protein